MSGYRYSSVSLSTWLRSGAGAECLLNGSKEKQLLEGLLVRKDGYTRDSGDIVIEPEPRMVQDRLFQ